MKSYMASPATIERKWYVVDATTTYHFLSIVAGLAM